MTKFIYGFLLMLATGSNLLFAQTSTDPFDVQLRFYKSA